MCHTLRSPDSNGGDIPIAAHRWPTQHSLPPGITHPSAANKIRSPPSAQPPRLRFPLRMRSPKPFEHQCFQPPHHLRPPPGDVRDSPDRSANRTAASYRPGVGLSISYPSLRARLPEQKCISTPPSIYASSFSRYSLKTWSPHAPAAAPPDKVAAIVRDRRQRLQIHDVDNRRRNVDMLGKIPHQARPRAARISNDQRHAQRRLIAAVLFEASVLAQIVAVIGHIHDHRISSNRSCVARPAGAPHCGPGNATEV